MLVTVPPHVQFGLPIKIIHYVYPALVFIYFIVASTITVCTSQTRSLRVKDQQVRRSVILVLASVLVGAYLIEAIAIVAHSFADADWFVAQDYTTYLLTCSIAFGIQVLAISESKFPVWYPYYGSWFIGIVFEILLLILANVSRGPTTLLHFVLTLIKVSRISILLILPFLYFRLRTDTKEYENDAERQALLPDSSGTKAPARDRATASGDGYGTTVSDTGNPASETASIDTLWEDQEVSENRIQARLEKDGSWWTYAKGFSVFIPFIWPAGNKALQIRIVLVGLCLLSSNAFNVLIPYQFGVMVDSVAGSSSGDLSVWTAVITYATLMFVSSTCIGWLRQWLWLPAEQRAYNALTTSAQAHLMSLSCDFHESRNSLESFQAMTGGVYMTSLLETICFQFLPLLIDIAVAFAFLWSFAGPLMGVIMVVTMVTYLYMTSKLVAERAKNKRDLVKFSRKEFAVGEATLSGWTNASLFNMIPYEQERYSITVRDNLNAKKRFILFSQVIGASQAAVMACGFLGTLVLATYQCKYEGRSVGNFSTLIVYWGQLSSPLASFSNLHQMVASTLIEAERLVELFAMKPSITDTSNAKPLDFAKGTITLGKACFSYEKRKSTLREVDFEVPAGKTFALVGETGGGKSTMFKLINRFYDVDGGSISIDGQDVRDVTLESIRSNIGVVPQEPMLFNDTIMNNVRYARLTASDNEVFEACKAAVIHEEIMSFPDGYNSKVGPLGARLSGGEKQRIAIARAILKRPGIILLDEATSSVDTETELLIQQGLKSLCKDKTTLIIAHRLSTIMRVDHILVVMDGQIVEEGNHQSLIQKRGKYYDLWLKQIFLEPETAAGAKQDASERTTHGEASAQASKDSSDEWLANKLDDIRHTFSSSPKPQGNTPDKVQHSESAQKLGSAQPGRGQKREGSKLKPDAPEFIPKRTSSKHSSNVDLRASAKQHHRSSNNLREAFKDGYQEKTPHKKPSNLGRVDHDHHEHHGHQVHQQIQESEHGGDHQDSHLHTTPASYRAPHDQGQHLQHKEEAYQEIQRPKVDNEHEESQQSDIKRSTDSKPPINNNRPSTGPSHSSENISEVKPKYKRSRFSRRHATKSEPTSRVHESGDGAQDSDMGASIVGSGEGSTISEGISYAQRRRVSAPSDPPGTQDTRIHRPRRTRHWRLKDKAVDRTGYSYPSSSSATVSGGISTDESVTVPYPSPAAVSQSTTPSVRFAPGV